MWGGFFKSSQKRSAAEFCDLLTNALVQWRDATEGKMKKRAREEASEYVLSIKSMLFGDALQQSDTDELLRRARQADLLMTLVSSLPVLEFEARKDAVQIFNNLLRRGLGEEPHNADMRRDVLEKLVQGYEDSDIALNCGSMLRECIRYEKLTALLLNSPKFWTFFDLVELSDFDVASDAFASFKEMLTRHVSVTAAFIEKEQDHFVASYNGLLRSANYVTRRQSLKLLGEMLLERANFNIMTTYIASATNLRLVMNLLLDQRKNIQFEAFHVFKIFVANPNKTPDVKQILIRNKDKLLAYLTDFLNDRVDDSFQEDRNLILEEIRKL